MKHISLITLTQGNVVALKRTIANVVQSFEGMVDEVIVGDMSIFEDDRNAIKAINPFADEMIEILDLDFNHLFKYGFGATLNMLADHAMNDLILYLNVGEIIEKNLISGLINDDYNCYKFNHATESHKWIRCYNRKELQWSGRIHEEVVPLEGKRIRCSDGMLFQMADTEKDDDAFKSAVYNDVKELTYWNQYLKLVDSPEEIGATNVGWIDYARDSYQHIKDRMLAKGARYEAFVEGNLQKYIDNCKEFEVPMSRPFTIIVPHYRTGKITAYCIHQLNKLRGTHPINIIVVDNSNGEGIEYFEGMENVTIMGYPYKLLQSHGIAFDFALEHCFDAITEYFITVESDSFPTQNNWLDYYENLINEGYEMAGSKLHLSGGEYLHPAGAMYKKSNWKEAKELVAVYNKMYHYLSNYEEREGFKGHLMNPSDDATDEYYLPLSTSVFHQGMGFKDESINTYGQRNIESEQDSILIPDGMLGGIIRPTFFRIGYEPGQWFSYWHYTTGKKVKQIPTLVKWMDNRVNQQQEYTMMEENEFKHLWAVTAYNGCTSPELKDIIDFKAQQMEDHYNSIK